MINGSFIIHALKVITAILVAGGLPVLSKYCDLKYAFLLATLVGVFSVLVLNYIICRKRMNSPFPEQYFGNIEECSLPEPIKKYLSTENIPVKILYYNNNDVNSHLIQRGYCSYIILTSAVMGQLTKHEMTALIFHEIGHIKGNHLKYHYFYCSSWDAAFIVFVGVLLYLYIGQSLSLLQMLILSFISLVLLGFCFRVLLCCLLRHQEYDADKFAVIHFEREYLVSALHKTNKALTKSIFSKHPDVFQRINKISNYAQD